MIFSSQRIIYLSLLTISGILSNASVNEILNNRKIYYVDSEIGDDSYTGTSPDKAWRSIRRANLAELNPGDSLLFKRNGLYPGILEVSAQGNSTERIVVGAYGEGHKPCVSAPDSSMYAVRIYNSDYLTLQDLEVVNHGKVRIPSRTGVKVECENYGISENIIIRNLYIHDVNGSLVKSEGGGSGVLIQNGWSDGKPISTFDSLVIENNIIRRCERNAMIWWSPGSRRIWHPSTNTVVRYNLIEEVPGDGIVPIGCDGVIVEYNLMRNCPEILPDTEAAAGIWPWSCDNAVIRFNEVSDHKAPWDAQGFDADYNCRNTLIEYNYSHDNYGGLILICNAGGNETNPMDNIGNIGATVRYNVSIGDGVRPRPTRVGMFSPSIHIAGPCINSVVENNIVHIDVKPSSDIDRSLITSDSWGGCADHTTFRNNIFYTLEPSAIRLTESTNNVFEGNSYIGIFTGVKEDLTNGRASEYYSRIISKDKDAKNALSFLFNDKPVGNGSATMRVINTEAIDKLFGNIQSEKK